MLLLLCLSFTLEAGKNKSKKKKSKDLDKISAIKKENVLSDEQTDDQTDDQKKFFNSIKVIVKKRKQREIELTQELKEFVKEKLPQNNE
jgi:hypothetical protein